jgi:hypothetical protein
MDKRGFSDTGFLNFVKVIILLIVLYFVYKAIMAQLG